MLDEGAGHVRRGQLDADKEPGAADVGDLEPAAGQGLELRHQVRAHLGGIGLQGLIFDHVEDGVGDGRRHRVAAERIEVLPTERFADLPAGDDGADRVSIAHRLAQRHHIGHNPMQFEGPEG